MTYHFPIEEFRCKCKRCIDSPILVSQRLAFTLQAIRWLVAEPMILTSAVRCIHHNKAEKGVKYSAHIPFDLKDGEGLVSHAADVRCTNSRLRYKLLHHGSQYFQRIGIARNFIHFDNDTRKPAEVVYLY